MATNSEAIEQTEGAEARGQLMTDLKALSRDAEELLKATAGDVSEKAKEARNRLSAAVQRAKTTCKELQDHTVASAKAAARKADATIREHPYESLGVAFGLGLLIGVLVARR